MIPLKSSKPKYEVVHEQKFKDLLDSTCQVSVEMVVLDLESEVMRGPGSIPTRGNILLLDFLYIVKPLIPILALLSMLCVCETPEFTKQLHQYNNYQGKVYGKLLLLCATHVINIGYPTNKKRNMTP